MPRELKAKMQHLLSVNAFFSSAGWQFMTVYKVRAENRAAIVMQDQTKGENGKLSTAQDIWV